ncbi:MAG: GNAT family N-acetyltransferase [Candidatus Pacebacteria bacterium]|nr:GNAT family N-acetyltransferase [Candidatus Paceibacterota bacterium]
MANGRKIIIRSAVEADLPEIKEMVGYLMEVEKSRDILGNVSRIMDERIKPAFRKSKNRIFIAEREGVFSGFGLVEFPERRVSSLSYIVIRPEFQKYGIGRKLAKEMIFYAKSKKADIMEVTVDKNNAKSRKFHKGLGFALSSYLFRKEL